MNEEMYVVETATLPIESQLRDLENRAAFLRKRVAEHTAWLENPVNKSRGTYELTASTARRVAWQLKEVEDKIAELSVLA